MSTGVTTRARLARAALDTALSGLDALSADPGWRWVLNSALRARGELAAVVQGLELERAVQPDTRPRLTIAPGGGR